MVQLAPKDPPNPPTTDQLDNLRINVIHAILSTYTVRRKIRDLVQLPELTLERVECTYGTEQLQDIAHIKVPSIEYSFQSLQKKDGWDSLQKGRLASIHRAMVIHLYNGTKDSEWREEQEWEYRVGLFKKRILRTDDSARIVKAHGLLVEYHENVESSRTLVFSVYRRSLDVLSIHLEQKVYPGTIFRIDNRMVPDISDRQKILDDFSKSPPGSVLMATLTCLQQGVSITSASRVIFLDETWSPVNEYQALFRVFQKGQTRDVLVQTLWGKSWVDDHLQEVRKRNRYHDMDLLQAKTPATNVLDHAWRDWDEPWYKFSADHLDPDKKYFEECAESDKMYQSLRENGVPASQLDKDYISYRDQEVFEEPNADDKQSMSHLGHNLKKAETNLNRWNNGPSLLDAYDRRLA